MEANAFPSDVRIVRIKPPNNRILIHRPAHQGDDDKQQERQNNNNNNDDDNLMDDWLDTPFFDPLAYEDDDESTWQARLANYVKVDYERFELLYAGAFLAFMLIVSQELFRMQLYGADYVPFSSNSQTVNELWKVM